MKYVLGIVGAVIVLIVAAVLILNRGSNPAEKPEISEIDSVEESYNEVDATYVFIQQGELKAKEDYREVRISLSKSLRKVEVVQGYDNKVIIGKSYPNSKAAFSTVLEAIKSAGFNTKREKDIAKESETGLCPLGLRYIYEVRVSGDQKQRLWSSSCRINGSSLANRRLVEKLFENQIPNYRELTKGVRL